MRGALISSLLRAVEHYPIVVINTISEHYFVTLIDYIFPNKSNLNQVGWLISLSF